MIFYVNAFNSILTILVLNYKKKTNCNDIEANMNILQLTRVMIDLI